MTPSEYQELTAFFVDHLDRYCEKPKARALGFP